MDFARSLGAGLTVDYSRRNLKEALKELTDGKGVDVVYDPVGGELAELALRATAWEGRFLVVGFASGDIPKNSAQPSAPQGLRHARRLLGRSAQPRPGRPPEKNMAQLLDWVQAGRLKPHIHAVYPLEGTAAALDEIAARKVRGKVIVRP
ncbi:zinc-binding dehydrogenase [Roseibium salinum]|nr:zinc-binding dehydrogenase [Roseibium salinum]